MDLSSIFKQVDGCLPEEMDGELLVYNPANATTLHLNGSSAIVWSLCDGQASVEAMIEALSETYPDHAEQISGDVVSVIEDLLERAFLEKVA